MQIEDCVALVTGANRGLGRAFARVLVERGAKRVYAGARDPEGVRDPDVVPVRLDITRPDQVAAAAERCSDVTLLVNNAANVRVGSYLGPDAMEIARDVMETNYLGTLAMCRAFAPVLARGGGGALVNMLSIISFFNRPDMGPFSVTKAALWSMTNGLRIELRAQGTLVVAVHSGFIDTEAAAGFPGAKHDPADVAGRVFDAVEAGREEVLMDERTRAAKAALPRDLELIYPEIEAQYRAARG
jgi:NAD(P)-dependent dehydrogenase (short-subunit alcohol dehydrogenase family)